MPELLKLFSKSSIGGQSGGAFAAGKYRIVEALIDMFKFPNKEGKEYQGKNGQGSCCLAAKLQPLDSSGDDVGEEFVHHWGIGDDYAPANKGRSVTYEGTMSSQFWDKCDYTAFLGSLHKFADRFDADALEEANDVSLLNGLVVELGEIPSKQGDKTVTLKDGTTKTFPKKVVVVTDIPAAKAKGGKKAAAPAKKEEEKEEAASGDGSSADDIEAVAMFLGGEVLTDKAGEKGVTALQVKIQLKNWVNKEYEGKTRQKEMLDAYTKNEAMVLGSLGWKVSGPNVVKK